MSGLIRRAIPSGCAHKHRYPRRKVAKLVAALASRDTGETIRAYHCLDCHCWHIGHPPGAPRWR